MNEQKKSYKFLIAGAGGIGRAVGLMLRELGDWNVEIFIGDADLNIAGDAAEWIHSDSSIPGMVAPFCMPTFGTDKTLNHYLENSDIVLDCLPGDQAPRMAKLALKYNLYYANVTEYVEEVNEIVAMTNNLKKGFILQAGLAPGFIDVLGMYLFNQFCKNYRVKKVDSVSLKVGALTKNAVEPYFYGYTWSQIGVATEYVEPAIVVRDYKKKTLPSLSERSTILIDGITYEEDLTSGGTADLPDALMGKVKRLDYKTLRYPGHYAWVDQLLKKIPQKKRASQLQSEMETKVPYVEDDVVVIYASVKGTDFRGDLRIKEKSYKVTPVKVGNKKVRAIQATTAAGLAECVRLLLTGSYTGCILQSQINPVEYIQGPFVSYVFK